MHTHTHTCTHIHTHAHTFAHTYTYLSAGGEGEKQIACDAGDGDQTLFTNTWQHLEHDRDKERRERTTSYTHNITLLPSSLVSTPQRRQGMFSIAWENERGSVDTCRHGHTDSELVHVSECVVPCCGNLNLIIVSTQSFYEMRYELRLGSYLEQQE